MIDKCLNGKDLEGSVFNLMEVLSYYSLQNPRKSKKTSG
jgi:hypothetical protein